MQVLEIQDRARGCQREHPEQGLGHGQWIDLGPGAGGLDGVRERAWPGRTCTRCRSPPWPASRPAELDERLGDWPERRGGSRLDGSPAIGGEAAPAASEDSSAASLDLPTPGSPVRNSALPARSRRRPRGDQRAKLRVPATRTGDSIDGMNSMVLNVSIRLQCAFWAAPAKHRHHHGGFSARSAPSLRGLSQRLTGSGGRGGQSGVAAGAGAAGS